MAHFAGVPEDSESYETRRRWVRRTVIAINVVLVLILISIVGAIGYTFVLYGKVDRLSLGLNGASASEPLNVLIVGSDSRSDLTKAERKQYGSSVGGQRSDTIMLAHLDPDKKSVSLVSFPRDLYVPIAGKSSRAKINSAFEGGKSSTDGAKKLIDTIENNFDVNIDHYVQVDFSGFKSIVDAIGGVNVPFPNPVRDTLSGLRIRETDENGCVRLYGDAALAYARSRHYQEYVNGRWKADPTSDFGRITRQQDFMKRVAARAVKVTSGSPLASERLVRKSVKYVKVDDGFGVKDILGLVKKYKNVDPQTIESLGAIEGDITTRDGQSVVIPDMDKAAEKLAIFRNGSSSSSSSGSSSTSPAFKPSEISVRVLNGSGVDKQAADVAVQMKAAGFTTIGSGPADSYSYSTTVIRYAPGESAKAKYVSSLIDGKVVLQQATLNGPDIEIVTGSTFGGFTAPTTASTTPSSVATAAASVTSTSVVASTTKKAGVGTPSAVVCPQ